MQMTNAAPARHNPTVVVFTRVDLSVHYGQHAVVCTERLATTTNISANKALDDVKRLRVRE